MEETAVLGEVKIRELADREEIKEVRHRFALALDTRDWDRPVFLRNHAHDHETRLVFGASRNLHEHLIEPQGLGFDEVDTMLALVRSTFPFLLPQISTSVSLLVCFQHQFVQFVPILLVYFS